tara:strand:- start:3235 stop:4725 length:1491 start_codon:yes stop_codon:yes gene_type:complete
MNKRELLNIFEQQQLLLSIQANHPLALARLWSPRCERWSGLENDERPTGCGEPMRHLHTTKFFCPNCNIEETRTSQKHALINMGTEAHLIGGGNRAGKTDLGAQLAVAVALGSNDWSVQQWLELNDLPSNLIQEQPTTVWCVALSYGDSIEYVRPKLDKYMPRTTTKSKWNAQDRATAVFENGGKIVCLSYEAGRKKFQGKGVKMVWIDEEGNDDQVFQECLLRTVDLNGRVLVTATPVDGLNWLFDQFVEEIRNGFTRVQISGLDNPWINSLKLRRTVAHMSEAVQRTRLFGDFVSQEGLVYSEFDPRHHVIEPFQIPEDGEVYRAVDFGVRNPWATLWVYRDRSGLFGADDALYVFREYYMTNRTTLENGREMLRLSRNDPKPRFTVADSAGKDARLILARELQVTTQASPKELGMNTMIGLVKEYLQIYADGQPRLFIFSSCTNLIQEMRKYRWSKTRNKDQPMKQDDHALDALRYLIGYLSRYDKVNHMRTR